MSACLPPHSTGSARAFPRLSSPLGGRRWMLVSHSPFLLVSCPGIKRSSPLQGSDHITKRQSQTPLVLPHPPTSAVSFPPPHAEGGVRLTFVEIQPEHKHVAVRKRGWGRLTSFIIKIMYRTWQYTEWIRGLVHHVAWPLQPVTGHSTNPSVFGKDTQ